MGSLVHDFGHSGSIPLNSQKHLNKSTMTHYSSLVSLVEKLNWENMPFKMAIALIGRMYHNFRNIVAERHGDNSSFEDFVAIVCCMPNWTSDRVFGLLYTDEDYKTDSAAHKQFIERRKDIEKVLMAGIKIEDITKSFDLMYHPKKQTVVRCFDEDIFGE
jgi:hypothetical protein